MNIIFIAMFGGLSLGQAAPNFGFFAAGRSAGYRLYKVINRQPAIDIKGGGVIPQRPLHVRSRDMYNMYDMCICL
jgi:hypothetical protein